MDLHTWLDADGGRTGRTTQLAAHLGIQKGDHLHVLVTPRGIELSPFDPALDEQLTIGRSVMKRYRSALRKLAE